MVFATPFLFSNQPQPSCYSVLCTPFILCSFACIRTLFALCGTIVAALLHNRKDFIIAGSVIAHVFKIV